jgi:hypothetical protein
MNNNDKTTLLSVNAKEISFKLYQIESALKVCYRSISDLNNESADIKENLILISELLGNEAEKVELMGNELKKLIQNEEVVLNEDIKI